MKNDNATLRLLALGFRFVYVFGLAFAIGAYLLARGSGTLV